jgi:hypothetical protein
MGGARGREMLPRKIFDFLTWTGPYAFTGAIVGLGAAVLMSAHTAQTIFTFGVAGAVIGAVLEIIHADQKDAAGPRIPEIDYPGYDKRELRDIKPPAELR